MNIASKQLSKAGWYPTSNRRYSSTIALNKIIKTPSYYETLQKSRNAMAKFTKKSSEARSSSPRAYQMLLF